MASGRMVVVGLGIGVALGEGQSSFRPRLLALKPWNRSAVKVRSCLATRDHERDSSHLSRKRCLRCNTHYLDKDNSPNACSFHGHATGEKGLFALAPPHQGIDGEWSDRSGVIVYRWNEENNRPNTGSIKWKRRWSCCQEYDEDALPCKRGWHVSYDDGFTIF